MGIPIPEAYIKTAPTFFKAVRGTVASFFTTASNSYVDVSNISSIASVPNNAKLLLFPNFSKATAGNGFIRITDGTNTFKELSVGSGGGTYSTPEIDGTVLQNSGGAATVKLQAKSDDANNVQVTSQKNSFLATDGDAPNVISGPVIPTSLKIPWKVSIEKIYLFYTANLVTTTDKVLLNSILSYQEITTESAVQDAELTKTYPNEQVSQYFQVDFEDALVAGQYVIWDWSGNGASFA